MKKDGYIAIGGTTLWYKGIIVVTGADKKGFINFNRPIVEVKITDVSVATDGIKRPRGVNVTYHEVDSREEFTIKCFHDSNSKSRDVFDKLSELCFSSEPQ
ncbi:hypothetical protein FACS1894132_05010 [Clostridia bacterium]|nr:hypothetical protein FACS1894132_05010 [Clostridia bacterium]